MATRWGNPKSTDSFMTWSHIFSLSPNLSSFSKNPCACFSLHSLWKYFFIPHAPNFIFVHHRAATSVYCPLLVSSSYLIVRAVQTLAVMTCCPELLLPWASLLRESLTGSAHPFTKDHTWVCWLNAFGPGAPIPLSGTGGWESCWPKYLCLRRFPLERLCTRQIPGVLLSVSQHLPCLRVTYIYLYTSLIFWFASSWGAAEFLYYQ